MWSVHELFCLWFLSLSHYTRAFPNPSDFIHCNPKYGQNIDVDACVAALATMPTSQAIGNFFIGRPLQPNEPRPQEWSGAEMVPVVYEGATGYGLHTALYGIFDLRPEMISRTTLISLTDNIP